jgi:Rieske Fe-S protein
MNQDSTRDGDGHGDDATGPPPSRRSVIGAAVAAATAALGATGCGTGDSQATHGAVPSDVTPSDAAPSGRDTATPGEGAPSGRSSQFSGAGAAAPALAKVTDIPVGGGKVIRSGARSFVVAQPKRGQFTGFDATCPHQGCAVDRVKAGVVHCPCHGSQFSVATGAVRRGPARKGLAKVRLRVAGGRIYRA